MLRVRTSCFYSVIMYIYQVTCIYVVLSDVYKYTDFGQHVRGSQPDRFPGLHNRHDACDAVLRCVSTQDGGKHISLTTNVI